MSSFNVFAQYYLAREVKAKLEEFKYRNDMPIGAVEAFKDLKEQILSGSVTVLVINPQRFKVEMNLTHYHQALCKRHYFGVRRMHRLCRSAERLAGVKWATAWTLTTCYYAAYFAALELLYVAGYHVTYLSPEEIEELNNHALPAADKAEAGTYLGVATYNDATDVVEIAYAQTAQKPHAFAWHQIKQLIDGTAAENAEAVRHRTTLLRLLGAGAQAWARPNEIRNLWNYVDATLFCERGEILGAGLNAKILAPEQARRWAVSKHVHSSEANQASGIAYIRGALVEAVDQVTDAVLPEKLALKRAS